MQQFLNSNGSYWRKWDLHVHSPSSILNSQFGDDWERYINTLESLNDISVVGITDYYSIEGYKKVKDYQINGRLNNIDLVLPNVELRLDLATTKDRPINIHVIFDPEVDHLIEKYFLEELEFTYKGVPYKCSNSDLIHLGEDFLKEPYSHKKALREGMKQFKVSPEKLNQVFVKQKGRFQGKYIIVVPNSNQDGNSGLKADSFKGIRREIYGLSHAIFSGNPKDRNYFLGEIDYGATIEQCGKIMPCIHGSDAHEFDKIGKPDKNRYTWIKAEPSFRGLLQILHEPKERVIIQDEHPDQKNDYNVIESIKFTDSDQFTNTEIKLNPGLNAVIGGKSSGKSLLLYKIAQAISDFEIGTREKEELWKNPYKGTFIEEVNLQVKWRNGEYSSVNTSDVVGKVTYIPQMYINSLSEDTANDVLQRKIREILLQDVETRVFWDSKKHEGSILKGGLSGKIIDLFEQLEKSNELDIKENKIGNLDSIRKEKDKIQEQIDEKMKSANLTQAEEDAINLHEKEKEEFNQQIASLKKIKAQAISLSENLQITCPTFNESLDRFGNLVVDFLPIVEELKLNIGQAFETAEIKISEQVHEYDCELINLENKVTLITKDLNPLLEKLKGLAEMQQLKKKLEEQDEYIKEIQLIREEKNQVVKVLLEIKDSILQRVLKMFNLKKEIVEYFNSKSYFKDIKVKAQIKFDLDGFDSRFIGLFNRRGKLSKIFPGSEGYNIFNDEGQFSFSEEDYVDKIRNLFEIVLSLDENKLKKGNTKQQAIEYLLDSYTNVIVDLERDGDTLSQMSPGKRGLVLLELFLEMSNEKHPILIDQPEDNLDNRTISRELVKFIKEKSPQRQIIIVTHNANLVVLTDSENVIVANQDAQLVENHSHRFEYITGALECDFLIKGDNKLTSKGIKSHVCEILEGGQEAFEIREKKYGF
ncbi:hypothetical protein PDJ82_20425 [Bacillus cereus group sp. TH43LC]|uniref:TrlF family AAA-like ATPase n=1 Tax=Bacillus cereus group TaxID=86661 RepID=UPI0022E7EF56|nr:MULTISPECIES: hypothetical protein [unclassified Bacillus cereus group]MDA1503946.1 hypothetical protein [Bacillus cereus group sp. TH43LC]MDA1790876.1 hypothetical protein [Bacillus cereus group sp. BY5-1LC]MDA1865784.1 hypothetical protein [Bacillus cereus group sp. BY128LC]